MTRSVTEEVASWRLCEGCEHATAFPTPWLTEVAGRLGFDVIWFDMEHRAHGYEVVDRLSVACRATDADLMVRCAKPDHQCPMRLEFVANGIMVPHCCSVPEARDGPIGHGFRHEESRRFDNAGPIPVPLLSDTLEF